ncbi:hypothetical protein [Lihuaxuella thermophila]|uniref:hypothetical protein n=1 Tax=Lihuaxuella thermophila TaxID=1173111 RepID=UPI0011140144|nr:hypothetical protein [Lihuaxuella thermophila]
MKSTPASPRMLPTLSKGNLYGDQKLPGIAINNSRPLRLCQMDTPTVPRVQREKQPTPVVSGTKPFAPYQRFVSTGRTICD